MVRAEEIFSIDSINSEMMTFLNYGEFQSFRHTSKSNLNIGDAILASPNNLPVSWTQCVAIYKLKQRIEAIESSYSKRSTLRKWDCFISGGMILGGICSCIGLLVADHKVSQKIDSLLNIWNQLNVTINNITVSCLSYLNSTTNICLVNNHCYQLSCQIGNSPETVDCKATYEDIWDACSQSSRYFDVSLGLIMFLVIYCGFRYATRSGVTLPSIPDELYLNLKKIIYLPDSIDDLSICDIQEKLAAAYCSRVEYSFFHHEKLLDQTAQIDEEKDFSYVKLPASINSIN